MAKGAVVLSPKEAEVVFNWNHWLRDELGSCSPAEGKCEDNYRSGIPQCEMCRRIGGFLGVEFKED